jgi:hypothetical protein
VSTVELLVARCAGLDVAKDEVVACIRVTDGASGRRQAVRTFSTFTNGLRWLGEVLVECAWAAARSRDSYLSAHFWRLALRIGKKTAAVAVGHSMLVIAWHLLTDDCDYQDLGGDYLVRHDADRARQRAVAQLQALGYQVTLQPLAA